MQSSQNGWMQGAPPAAEKRITLDNWFIGEPVGWSFKNVQQLVPCAEAHRGTGPVSPIPNSQTMANIAKIEYVDQNQKRWTVPEMLAHTYTDGFLILRKGEAVFEQYFGLEPHQRHLLQSVSKSFTACLAGVFIEQGILDVARPISHYLPDYAASAYGDASVQQLLDMTVAVEYTEDYEDMGSDVNIHTISAGWYGPKIKAAGPKSAPESLYEYLPTLQTKADFEHGEKFHYVSANTDVLGILLERIGGKPFAKLFEEHIWQHMGAEENMAITVDPWGCAFPCGGFNVTLRDLGRFGLLCLHDGFYNDRQIVPAQFFRDVRQNGSVEAFRKGADYSSTFPNAAYRNQFWKMGNENGAFFGVGIHGQYVYIDPAAEIVIAKLSSHPRPLVEGDFEITLLGFEAIVQALS